MGLKICTIGCGKHSSNVHGPSYRKYKQNYPDTVLAACCDLDKEKAHAFKESFGFERYYTDLDYMLDMEKPDAVCLVSAFDITFKLASHILQRGYPLMMEKPQAKTREEAAKLLDIANKNNVPNQVAYNRRFDPLMSELKKLLDRDYKPEDINDIRYEMFRVGRAKSFVTAAVHGIDVVRHLGSADFSYIRFSYQELPKVGPEATNMFMECTFESGATAHINLLPAVGVRIERATVNLHNNTYFCNTPMWFEYDVPGSLIHIQNEVQVLNIKGADLYTGSEMFETAGFYQENVSFFEDIRAGKKPTVNLATTLQTIEIEECLAQRAKEYVKHK